MSDIFKDYYKILNIGPEATRQEIRSAYLTMSKKYHPDKNPGKDMTSLMQDINEAYAILKDENKKLLYDCEYSKFMQTKHIKEEQSKTETSYSYNYDIQDEILKEDIESAREYAHKFVEEFFNSLKSTAKVAAEGAWDGVKGYICIGVLLSLLGGMISTCLSYANSKPSNIYVSQLNKQEDVFTTYSTRNYSIRYPQKWKVVNNPDPYSDIYIGDEMGNIGFTILHFEVNESLEVVNQSANQNAKQAGMTIIKEENIFVKGLKCYKTVFFFSIGGVSQVHVSYLLKKNGTIYNIKFGGLSHYMNENTKLTDRIIQTFEIK